MTHPAATVLPALLLAAAAAVLLPAGSPVVQPMPARAAPRPKRQVPVDEQTVALVLDLVAGGLAAGATLSVCLETVAAALELPELTLVSRRMQLGADHEQAWMAVDPAFDTLRVALELVAASGASAAGLLRDAATRLRAQAHARAQEQAAALGVRLVLPLGLCALPAFVCWAVLPVVLALLQRIV